MIKFAAAGTAVEPAGIKMPQQPQRPPNQPTAATSSPCCSASSTRFCKNITRKLRRSSGCRGVGMQQRWNVSRSIRKISTVSSLICAHIGPIPPCRSFSPRCRRTLVICLLCSPNCCIAFPFNHDLRQKQAEYAQNAPYTAMVPSEGLRPCPDFIYLNTNSTVTLGERLAAATIPFLQKTDDMAS
jgi:hypothetical protein